MSADFDLDNNNRELTEGVVSQLNSRIDDIVAFQKRNKPWYRDTSIMISVAAFLTSIAVSGLSAYHTYRQDINSRRDSLQSIIQQFHAATIASISSQHAIKKEIYEIQKDINAEDATDDQSAASDRAISDAFAASSAITGAITATNAELAKKALNFVDELGGYQWLGWRWLDSASSIDEFEVGLILFVVNQYDSSERVYKRSVDSAQNSYEYLGAVRGLAQVQYQMGKVEESTASMNKALVVFEKFPDEISTNDYKNWRHFETYTQWLNFISSGDCNLAQGKLSEASRYASLLLPSTASNGGAQGTIDAIRARFQTECHW